MEIKIGSRVHISTHGRNVGTITKIFKSIYGFIAVVQMDCEPAPRGAGLIFQAM